MKVGLRIDVDTFRGTKYGVPNLCQLLADYCILATFFFSVGPDNMGRHLWRLLRPTFLWKMIRTRASKLYGWDILLRGTFWPGPVIGERLGNVIGAVSEAGHEVGLHAWDHHAWQKRIDRMDRDEIYSALNKGVELLERILDRSPVCSAAPAWKSNDRVLSEKTRFFFAYNSDCRGKSLFRPVVAGNELAQPQIPVTLPTYDEVIGRYGISQNNFYDYLLSLLDPKKLNVLTIHAEVEGMACLKMFSRFIKQAQSRGAAFVPLGTFLEDDSTIVTGTMVKTKISGRDGWVACQASIAESRNVSYFSGA